MTDNEIIKALELCLAEKITKQTCGKCPYHQFGKLCKVERSKDALDLINRQKAEIERLKEGIKFERERVDNIPNLLQQSKSEAVREFAERVNQLTTSYWFDNINKEHIDYIVKEIVKEMVGDAE